MSDNPFVRDCNVCPLCNGPKSIGLIACWPCFRKHDMRNGNRDAEERIAAYDEMLEMSDC